LASCERRFSHSYLPVARDETVIVKGKTLTDTRQKM